MKGVDGRTIGQRIGCLREEKGFTQQSLADTMGIPRENVRNWEDDKRGLKPEMIVLLANTLSVSTDFLLGLSEFPTRDESVDGACRCTGLSVKAVQQLHTLKEADGSIESVSCIIETDQFRRLVQYLDDTAFYREQVNEAIERLAAIGEPVPDAIFKENGDGERVLISGDPVKQSLMVNAEMDIREYLPRLRVQLLELNELWSELLETIMPTKEIVRQGIDLSKKFGIR